MKSIWKKTGMIGMMMLVLLLSACGSGGSDSANGGAKEGEKEKPVLKMATSADFPPFESRDEKGNFIGFDIDLAKIIADELGYQLEIQDMNFEGLIGALQSGRVDMVMAGMSATKERKENVDFSMEYHRSGEMFISLPDSPVKQLEDLKGKKVGVQLGTIQEEGADELSKEYGFEVKKVDNGMILVQELLSHKIDVAYLDKQVAKGYMKEHGFTGFDDPTSSSPGMAVAFPKGSDLVEKVNGVLKELQENGKLKELKDKWKLDQIEE
ncbi:transporter substrate-binding domain-containing protein [Caldibacillus debilis]|uniref:transporter substrate-binding domain-containing protein n=1 Tax=Caldibacillus debilis TaxID=301148 RepID=UPI002FDA7A56